MRRRGRLARKYAIVLVALVTGALLASGAVEIYSSYNENQAALVTLQREKAAGAASRIESFVREIERQLVWTTQPLLVSSSAALEQRRIDAVRVQRLAMDVVGSQTDYSADPKFRVPKSGRTYFGPVYFRKESEPYMSIAMPQAGGGVTVAEVNLKFIWDVVSRIKVGKAGLAYTVDSGGVLIAHPDISLVLQQTSLADLAQVKAALARGEVTIAKDVKGRDVLTAYSVIAPLGWVVIVEQPLEEAFEPLRASAYRTILMVGLGIALSVVASALLARRLARPIQVLQQSAAKIGAGELDHQIAIRTGNELEALADEFNWMTRQLRESYATLEQRVEARTRELSEALEQQTATSEILRVISGAQRDVQPVFETIVQSAVRLCNATTAAVFRVEGGTIHEPANYGGPPEMLAATRARYPRPLDMESTPGIAILTRSIVQFPDTEDPSTIEFVQQTGRLLGIRSVVTVPLLREAEAIGAIVVTRREPGRFSDAHIELLKTFADQAVIAIDNVRLFKELEEKNHTITEALDQQTATAEILRVISSSPTDVQPVLDAVAENATRVCEAGDGAVLLIRDGAFRVAAHYGTISMPYDEAIPVVRGTVAGRAVLESGPVHVPDPLAARPDFPEGQALGTRFGNRTTLSVPLLRESTPIGALLIRRTEVRPFTDTQIALLQTFADQAVIAIENVRLFQELQARNRTITEALDQQTAT